MLEMSRIINPPRLILLNGCYFTIASDFIIKPVALKSFHNMLFGHEVSDLICGIPVFI